MKKPVAPQERYCRNRNCLKWHVRVKAGAKERCPSCGRLLHPVTKNSF